MDVTTSIATSNGSRYLQQLCKHFAHKIETSFTPEQGLWMPFARISQVEGWKDFGFKFKEGNNETQWDDRHGIITFRYTEPMTWWMRMPKEMPRTMDAALAELPFAGDWDWGKAREWWELHGLTILPGDQCFPLPGEEGEGAGASGRGVARGEQDAGRRRVEGTVNKMTTPTTAHDTWRQDAK